MVPDLLITVFVAFRCNQDVGPEGCHREKMLSRGNSSHRFESANFFERRLFDLLIVRFS